MRKKALVDAVGNEGGERCQASGESKKDLKKGVQGVFGILETKLALQSLAVEANVPVGGVVDQIQQTRDDSVQTVA